MTRKALILAGFIVLKFVLQYFLISPEYDLHRDEFLHLDQGKHVAWGYVSVPPVTSWVSYIILLLGGSEFWVKFFPALFGALTLVVVWKAIGALNGNLFALLLGATCVLLSVLLRINGLYQPNSLDVLCWTGFYFVLLRYIQTQHTRWFYYGAIVMAIGFLNKYNFAFLLIGLLPAILFSKHRIILAKSTFWYAMLLAFILILPNLIWQYQNDFPVVWHMQELAKTQLVNVDRWDFLKEQLLFFIGGLVVLLAAFYALLFYKPFQPYRFYFWSLVFTLAVFVSLKAKGYYAIGLYPIYLSFGAVFLSKVVTYGWRIYLKPVLLLLPVLLFLPAYAVVFPNKSPEYIANNQAKYKEFGLLRWEDGKDHTLPQDFADMLGWKELATKVDSVYATLPKQQQTLILCDNYGQAGAINFYSKHNLKAVSFNADYLNWFELDKKYVNLIRVKNAWEVANELAETKPYFHTSEIAGSVTNPLAREYGTTIFAFTGAKVDINQRIKHEIELKKKQLKE